MKCRALNLPASPSAFSGLLKTAKERKNILNQALVRRKQGW